MTSTRALPALLTCLACLALPAVAASAEPAPTTGTPVTPPAVQAAGKLKLVFQHVGGDPLFAPAGKRVVIRGIVIPYVPNQSVKVSFYREGQKVEVKTVAVQAVGNGAGQFHLGFLSRDAGRVIARATHYATPEQAAFIARSRALAFVHTNVASGSHGFSVRVMQSELAGLHFASTASSTKRPAARWSRTAS